MLAIDHRDNLLSELNRYALAPVSDADFAAFKQQVIRALGRRSLGLVYSLVGTDTLLATILPSNSARAGGVMLQIGSMQLHVIPSSNARRNKIADNSF